MVKVLQGKVRVLNDLMTPQSGNDGPIINEIENKFMTKMTQYEKDNPINTLLPPLKGK